jgi:hypothetical protein
MKIALERDDLETLINLVNYVKIYDIVVVNDKIVIRHAGGAKYGHLPVDTEIAIEELP